MVSEGLDAAAVVETVHKYHGNDNRNGCNNDDNRGETCFKEGGNN